MEVQNELEPAEQPSLKALRAVKAFAQCHKSLARVESAEALIPEYLESDRQWKRAKKERPINSSKVNWYLYERNEVCDKYWGLLEEANDIQIDVDVNIHGVEPEGKDEAEPVG